MDLFRKEEFYNLATKSDDVCISIYMPTHRVGSEQQPTRRLRTLQNGDSEDGKIVEEQEHDTRNPRTYYR